MVEENFCEYDRSENEYQEKVPFIVLCGQRVMV